MMGWIVLENVITLSFACGLTTAFYFRTQSKWSFLWLLLLININYFKIKKGKVEGE